MRIEPLLSPGGSRNWTQVIRGGAKGLYHLNHSQFLSFHLAAPPPFYLKPRALNKLGSLPTTGPSCHPDPSHPVTLQLPEVPADRGSGGGPDNVSSVLFPRETEVQKEAGGLLEVYLSGLS